MSTLTAEQIHNAMFSSKEGYVAYVIDSIEFDLGRILTDEEQRSVAQFVDGVVTTNANEIVLPERYEIDMCPTPSPDGEWYSRDDVLAALAAAGARVKGEE